MAINNNPIFKVDAGSIISKLHVAGRNAVKGYDVVNSGILNDNGTDSPDSLPSNIKFMFTDKNPLYGVLLYKQYDDVPVYSTNTKDLDTFNEKVFDELTAQLKKYFITFVGSNTVNQMNFNNAIAIRLPLDLEAKSSSFKVDGGMFDLESFDKIIKSEDEENKKEYDKNKNAKISWCIGCLMGYSVDSQAM